jgi:hypothetical protein
MDRVNKWREDKCFMGRLCDVGEGATTMNIVADDKLCLK